MSDTRNQWIPVSERLPERTVEKLVLLTNGERCVAFIGGVSGKWTAPGIGIITQPTHWMDLPEPPQPPKPSDPFQAWADENARSFLYFNTESCHAAWNAAKEHYAKPMPDFEAWWDSDGFSRVNPLGTLKERAKGIWSAAQGKPEA